MVSQFEIPLQEVQRRLNADNPWWRSGGGIDPEEAAWPRRAYFPHFRRLALETRVRRAVVLIGPRRVGKTVMLKHFIQGLIDEGVAGVQVLYVSLDTPLYSGRSLDSLVRLFMDLHRHTGDERLWILFDEVQYLKDWEVHLKSLVDTYPRIRFIASGSAAAALRMKSRESGAGRFTDFILPPLTFAEYLNFANQETALIRESEDADGRSRYSTPDLDALNREFLNYLKVYLTNPSVRAALFGFVGPEDEAMGNLAETAVWSQWLHDTGVTHSLHYARWKSGRQDLEVDIVSVDPPPQKPRFAVEIKWSDRPPHEPRSLRGIRDLATRHPLAETPLVTTRTHDGSMEIDGIRIEFVPAALYCYTIARHLLKIDHDDLQRS